MSADMWDRVVGYSAVIIGCVYLWLLYGGV
jgi:hypothetical protein